MFYVGASDVTFAEIAQQGAAWTYFMRQLRWALVQILSKRLGNNELQKYAFTRNMRE
jgi:hypothetical protein